MKGNNKYHIGQRLELRPFTVERDDIRQGRHYETYEELFVENVRYRGYSEKTDNAIIEDGRGNIRLCSIDDLRITVD